MVENFYGSFSRSFTLPENVDKENINAEFTDGILKLEIPKVEVKENKTSIKIK
jgi:HSP20 family protein